MKKKNRRDFLRQTFKGAVVGLFSLLPGSLFNPRFSFAAKKLSPTGEDTIESVLRRVTKDNLYAELKSAKLSPEEKLAIASVKEIPRDEVKAAVEVINRGGVSQPGTGSFCGYRCGGGCGTICGLDCPGVPMDAIAIVDQKGKLGFKIKDIDKSRFLAVLDKALELIK